VRPDKPHILLVNPWIHDFAAYDVWAKPLGLLILAAILRKNGYAVSYIDCLDRFHLRGPQSDPYARNGRGPYLKKRIRKPDGLEDVARHYCRYGIKESWFHGDLVATKKPDLIMVTSMMTYWYPGVFDTIRVIKEIFPKNPLVLGGIYASLCFRHAKMFSGADKVITGPCEQRILEIVAKEIGDGGASGKPLNIDDYPYPAYDLQNKISYVPILTSRGCPFSCSYCASGFLSPGRAVRNPDQVVEEILFWHEKYQIRDFVFYDDALLVDAENQAFPLFEAIIRKGRNVRFHTPNALHIREISKNTARLLFRAGFETIRLGLENVLFDVRESLDRKVTESEFCRAASNLKDAGFREYQIGAYLLVGLPGQSLSSIEKSIMVVRENHITPVLAYYTPIPHTKMWKSAVASSRYDIEADPVFSNNAVFPCMNSFSWDIVSQLKKLAAGGLDMIEKNSVQQC
jgi:hypothetical protein